MEEFIKETSKQIIPSLQNIVRKGTKNSKAIEINCGELEDENQTVYNINTILQDLKKMKGPCLYYFELLSNYPTSDIIGRIKKYSKTENAKATPTIKRKTIKSNILYVGKVKRYFAARTNQHLGYCKSNRTQGLQLCYWAKEIKLKVKLVVFEFEPEMIELVGILENELAKKLNPILGQHK